MHSVRQDEIAYPACERDYGFNLLVQQIWFQIKLIQRHVFQAEPRGNLFPIEGCEYLNRGLRIELAPRHRIDMVHHQIDIILCQIIKGCPFRKNVPNVFMIALTATFLIGLLRVAVENIAIIFSGLGIHFDGTRIGELRSAIRQDHPEDINEVIFKLPAQQIIRCSYFGCCFCLPQEHELKIAVTKKDSENDLAAFLSFDGIHLTDGEVRIGFSKSEKVRIGPPNMALLVYMEDRTTLFAVRLAEDLPPKIRIVDVEDSFVDVIINGTHRYRHAVCVFTVGNRKGHTIFDQWDHGSLDLLDLLSGETDPGPGVAECQAILFVCALGNIESFQKIAVCSVGASVADIGRAKQPWANDRFIPIAVLGTFGADGGTGPLGAVRDRTLCLIFKDTIFTMLALAPGRLALFLQMSFDFTADGGTILSNILGDLRVIAVGRQALLDPKSVIKSELFHGFLLSGQDTKSILSYP